MAAFTAQWEALYHSSWQVLGDSGRQWTEGDTGSEGGKYAAPTRVGRAQAGSGGQVWPACPEGYVDGVVRVGLPWSLSLQEEALSLG